VHIHDKCKYALNPITNYNLFCFLAIGLRVLSFEDKIRLAAVVESSVMSADEAAEFTASIEKHLHALISLTV